MIDNYLLEELVAFQKYGTLSRAADELALTPPAVTSGMKKLEGELGVKLFKRDANKVSLTKTGEFAAEKAKQVLQTNNDYLKAVQNFDFNQTNIEIFSPTPGPLVILKAQDRQISTHLATISDPGKILQDEQAGIVLTVNKPIENRKIDFSFLGTEQLFVSLNQFSELASQKEVNFSELRGLPFLILKNIGAWLEIVKAGIPNAKFLYQNKHLNFDEIRANSALPYFTTNLAPLIEDKDKKLNQDRVILKITDLSAKMNIYANYLKTNDRKFDVLIKSWQTTWSKAD